MRAALESHNRAFAAIGGVAALLVPDNTKVEVIKACLHDPVINRTYADMAAHYGTAVLPARPYKPRDKAKVEVGALIAECWLLGQLGTPKDVLRRRRPTAALAVGDLLLLPLAGAYGWTISHRDFLRHPPPCVLFLDEDVS